MIRSRTAIRYIALSAWVVWALTALFLLLHYEAPVSFVLLYLIYLVFGGLVLKFTASDILAPPGLFTIAGFLAFGLSLPLIYTGDRTLQTSDTTWLVISDDALFRVLILFLIAKASFILGSYTSFYRFVPLRWVANAPHNSRKASIPTYVALVVVVVFAGFLRIQLHLGEAGEQPSFPYAGVLQYTLFDGVLLASMWFLAQGLRQSRLYVLLGLSLLLMIAITQAFLGWRGGIIQMTYVAIGLFWYQIQYRQRQRPHTFGWLLALLVSASALIQFGNAIRVARLGGTVQFATSFSELIQKIAFRSQGTTRLAAITDHFGPLTFFNDFFINDLIRQGLTVTTYIDRTLYAVRVGQSHSVGPSGPGSGYVAMGLVGVAIAYLLLGGLYRSVYSGMTGASRNGNNILYIVLYSYLMFILASLLSESFDVGFVKNMIAVLAMIFLVKFVIIKRRM